MRNFVNVRKTLPSIDDTRLLANIAHIRPKRAMASRYVVRQSRDFACAIARSHTSPRNLDRFFRAPGPRKRITTVGNLAYYSTTKGDTAQRSPANDHVDSATGDAAAEQNGVDDNSVPKISWMTRLKSLFSYGEKALVSENKDAPREIQPDEEHYDDLLESRPSGTALPGGEATLDIPEFLLKDPTGHIHNELFVKGTVRLDFQEFVQEGVCFVCKVGCTINRTADTVIGQGTGTSKKQAKKEAYTTLALKFHKAGLLSEIKEPGLNLKRHNLHLDDDMLISMKSTLRGLRSSIDSMRKHSKRRQEQLARRQIAPIKSTQRSTLLSKIGGRPLAPRNVRVLKQNKTLPITARKDQILEHIENNTYSLLVADTGSGKSTQVPQMLLDHALTQKTEACRVLCVQPRKIGATSLAHRVAKERHERVGDSVGVCVRFDSRLPAKDKCITYCTNGIALNFMRDPDSFFDTFSHVILDEVHERNLDLDLFMLLLKTSIQQRQARGEPVPKVTVMSATLDIPLFASYFQNRADDGTLVPAPHLKVQGFAYPVSKHYIDGILRSLSGFYKPAVLGRFLAEPTTRQYLTKLNILSPLTDSVDEQPAEEQSAEEQPTEELAEQPAEEPAEEQTIPQPADAILKEEDPNVPFGLISAVIYYILSTTKHGSIMVFLPGMRHLLAASDIFKRNGDLLGSHFLDRDRYRVILLHATMPEGLKELFAPVPAGCRRIIFTTDVAETSITVPDVTFVVDSGKVHQKMYDPLSRSSRLACCWASQSSVAQRAGRAGRVQKGNYIALFTKEMQDSFRVTKYPAMMRENLQATSLRAKQAIAGTAYPSIQSLLQESIEAPEGAMVDESIKSLQRMSALDEQEELTPLGNMLLDIPLDPSYAKLIWLGVIFRCLDPLLIIGAMDNEQGLFHLSSDTAQRKEASERRLKFSNNSWSDYIGMVNAFKEMRRIRYEEGRGAAVSFAYANHINTTSFQQMFDVSKQIVRTLSNTGIIPGYSSSSDLQFGGPSLNVNSGRVSLIKALLLQAVHPNIAAPRAPIKSSYRTEDAAVTYISKMSVNARRPKALYAFGSKRSTASDPNTFMVHQTSHVPPLAACLFGGHIQAKGDNIRMDSWVDFDIKTEGQGNKSAGRLLIELRKAVDESLSLAFDALSTRKNKPFTSEDHESRLACDTLLQNISELVIEVINRDIDPVYRDSQREAYTTEPESIYPDRNRD